MVILIRMDLGCRGTMDTTDTWDSQAPIHTGTLLGIATAGVITMDTGMDLIGITNQVLLTTITGEGLPKEL